MKEEFTLQHAGQQQAKSILPAIDGLFRIKKAE